MTHLIDKDALENILRGLWKEDDGKNSEHRICYNKALQDVQCEIDTLEVKEVDLEKYYHDFLQKEWFGNSHVRTVSEMMAFTAKHFFELGLKVAQKGEEV